MSPKLNRKAVDFQPDAVEIAMRPLPLFARLGVPLGFCLFLGGLLASYFCQVDVIVEGSGKLVSVNQNIVILENRVKVLIYRDIFAFHIVQRLDRIPLLVYVGIRVAV